MTTMKHSAPISQPIISMAISRMFPNASRKGVPGERLDILIVVDMFLTGFDSKPLNTLYVDRNLKYHTLAASLFPDQPFSKRKPNHTGTSYATAI